jgi:hypothetical protein
VSLESRLIDGKKQNASKRPNARETKNHKFEYKIDSRILRILMFGMNLVAVTEQEKLSLQEASSNSPDGIVSNEKC